MRDYNSFRTAVIGLVRPDALVKCWLASIVIIAAVGLTMVIGANLGEAQTISIYGKSGAACKIIIDASAGVGGNAACLGNTVALAGGQGIEPTAEQTKRLMKIAAAWSREVNSTTAYLVSEMEANGR